jgi:hypothetical protein
MENPNRLALLIHFVKNPVNSATLAKQETANISLGVLRFASQGATIGKLLQGIQRVMASVFH